MIKLAISYLDEKGFAKAKTFNFSEDFDVDKWINHHYPICLGFHVCMPLSHRIRQAIHHFAVGLKEGYPICCITHYCIDQLLGLPSGVIRYSDRTEYVECWICLKRNGGKQRYPFF